MKCTEDYSDKIVRTISFGDNEIVVIEHNGRDYISLKPIMRAIGLMWPAQYRLICEKTDVGWALNVMIGSDRNGKISHIAALPWECVYSWLIKIRSSRYKIKTRRILMEYQEYFYNALNCSLPPAQQTNPLETEPLVNALEEEKKARHAAETMLAETRQTLIETGNVLTETKCKSNKAGTRNIRNKNI